MPADLRSALVGLSAALADVDPGQLVAVPVHEVLELAQLAERVRRQLSALDVAATARLEQGHAAHELTEHGARTTAELLTRALRLSPAAAKRRVAEAGDIGPRVDAAGAMTAPIFPTLASAVATGDLDTEHVREIRRTLDALPGELDLADAEAQLVTIARRTDPAQLHQQALLLRDRLDPDHQRQTRTDQLRRRSFTLRLHGDGSSTARGEFTPELTLKLMTAVDALSAPRPEVDGTPDPRSAPQRRHDALLDIADRVLSGRLPDTGGVPVTLVITATADQLADRNGRVSADQGQLIDTELALRLTDGADTYLLAFDDITNKLTLGRRQRLASPAQRRALAARDGGCSIPGCHAPPAWCQVHHVIPWRRGGPTDLDNLTLLCGHHHRTFETSGWSCRLRDGRPVWTPPRSAHALAA